MQNTQTTTEQPPKHLSNHQKTLATQ